MISLEEKIKRMLPLVSRPARYLGNEINSIHKDHGKVDLKVVLAFPDTYEVGMSHLGLKILYHILNAQDNILAERVYTPWIDAQEIMKKESIPLFSLESHTPLKDFDLIGFSLQYELTYTNLLTMLDLAGIPLKGEERKEALPLVIAGGPGAYSPEPLADFMDCFVMGDGEEVILEIARVLINYKKASGLTTGSGFVSERLLPRRARPPARKEDLLVKVARVPGVYVPSLYEVSYHLDGKYKSFQPKRSEVPERIKKRVIPDLDRAYYPTQFILPFLNIVHDRIILEVRRGCGRGCRFCQGSILHRPARERSIDRLLSLATDAIEATGYEELSLSSLNVGDYRRLEELILSLGGRLAPFRISLTLPSSRVETFPLLLEGKLKKSSVTLAPEAAQEPLRGVINKLWNKEEFLKTVERIASIHRPLKLYFMLGLPEESKEDIAAIVELVKEVKRRHPSRVSLSLAPFVPKAHTPFQWRGQEELSELKEKISYLKRNIPKGIEVRAHNPEASFLEAVFSQGDRRLGEVLLNAYRKGCRFDSWREKFEFHLWQEAFSESNIDPSFYANRRKDYQELLSWDHIDTEVSKEFLIKEDRKASRSVTQLPSYPVNQSKTGKLANRQTGKPTDGQTDRRTDEQTDRRTDEPTDRRMIRSKQKIRLKFIKGEEIRYISHLDMVRVFTRAIRRARLPIATTCGFVPREKISFSSPLSLGLISKSEYVDLEFSDFINPEKLKVRLNKELPSGLRVEETETIPLKSKSLMVIFDCAEYEVKLSDLRYQMADIKESIKKFLAQREIIIKRETKKGVKVINIRPLILNLELKESFIKMLLKIKVRPQEVVKALLNLSREETLGLIIERKDLLKI